MRLSPKWLGGIWRTPIFSQMEEWQHLCSWIIRFAILHGSSQIVNTHELREKIKEYLEIPSYAIKAYIAVNNVEDDDETAEPRFNIIWTTHKLMERISDNLTQDDATYRLVWQGMFIHIDVILCVTEGCVFTLVKHYMLLATCIASNVWLFHLF